MCTVRFHPPDWPDHDIQIVQTFCTDPQPPYWAVGWHTWGPRQDRLSGSLFACMAPDPSDALDVLREAANDRYERDSAPQWVRQEGSLRAP